MKKIDFHIHPSYSMDSVASVEGMAQEAMKKGLSAICFTTHIDLNPFRNCLDDYIVVDGVMQRLNPNAIERYIDDVRITAERHEKEIDILCGFEFSYGKHFEDKIASFLGRYKPDFYLGAIHCLENIGITAGDEAPGYLRSYSARRCAAQFVQATRDLVESGLFKTIAHIDGIKKYARAFYGNEIDKYLEEFFPPVFERISALDIGLEINTSALRRGHPDLYPSKNILKIAKKYSVKINSVGSDAHTEKQVGYEIELAMGLIEKMDLPIGEPLRKYV